MAKSIQEALAEVQRKINEQRAERLNDMIEAVGPPVPSRRGEGVTGIALANQGVSRENRRDQAYVDSIFGAGKMKAGSAESNLALLAHAKKQQQAAPAPSLGTQGPNQSGSASPQLPPNATDAEKAKKAEITQQDQERADGKSIADQRAAGENVSGSMRNVATGLDSKNTGNVQADASKAAVASGQDTSTTGKVMNSLTTSLSKDQGPPKAGEFGSKEDMAKEVASTPPSRGIIGGIKDFFNKPSTPAPAPAPAASSAPAPAASAPTPPPRPAEAPAPAPAPAARPSLRGAIANINGPEESESGPNKGKKKMSESALIGAFLKLQDTNHSNIFEAAKKMKGVCPRCGKSPCQCAGDPKKMEEETVDEAYGSNEGKTATGTKWSDNSVSVSVHHDGKKHTFTGKHDYVAKKLKDAHGMGMHQVNFKKASDMKEEALDEKLVGNQKKLDKNHNNKLDSQDFKMLRGSKKMEEETEKLDESGNPVNKVKKNAAVSAVGAKNRDDHYLDRMNPDVADKIRGREKLSGKDRQWNMEEEKKPKPDFLDLDKDGNKKESMKKAAKDAKKMEEETIEEASYSAKAARAGKDIGKPGKQFSKISASAAKRYGSKAAGERVAGAILAKMRAKHEWEEETEKLDEGGNQVNKVKKNAAVSAVGAKNRDDHYLDRMNPDVADKIRGREKMSGVDRKQYKEEISFSDAELAHIASIVEGAGPVDQGKGDQRRLRGQQTSRGIGDTVPNRDLTDEYEYMDEMARGVKAGTKRGSYKNTKSTRGGMSKAEAPSMPDEAPTGVPHVLDQIRHGREDEQGFKTITHPASSPEAPVTKSIHRSELHGFYDQYHNTEKPAAKEKVYGQFLDKHFGDSRTSAPTSKAVTTDLSKIEKSNLKGGAGKISLGGSKLVGGKK